MQRIRLFFFRDYQLPWGHMPQSLVVVKTANLSNEQRELFLSHLSSLSSLRLDDAQFNFGDKVTVEVIIPQRLVSELHVQSGLPPPMSLTNPQRSQLNVSFDASSIAGLSPIVGGGRRANGAGPSPPDDFTGTPPRSCQWLHKMIDDIIVFRQRQYHYDLMEASQPANGPVHNRAAAARCTSSPTAGKKPIASAKPRAADDLTIAAFKYLSEKFGMTTMVKRHASDLLDCVRAYRAQDLDVQLFGLFLMSQAYDSIDLQEFMQWRDILLPYTIQKQEATSGTNATNILRRFVRVREIPGLFRKCLVDRCEHSSQDAHNHELHWHRVRAALHTWCDPLGRFPAVVADPNFYCPPFRPTNPYVGRPPWDTSDRSASSASHVRKQLLALEGRFQLFSAHQVVPMAQLLTVLLLSWKEERLCPTPSEFVFVSDPAGHRQSTTPRRSTSASRTSRTRSPATAVRASTPTSSRQQTPPAKGKGAPPSQQGAERHQPSRVLSGDERDQLYHSLVQQRQALTPPQLQSQQPTSRSVSAFVESSLDVASEQTSPSFQQLQPPQPHPHPQEKGLDAQVTTTPLRTTMTTSNKSTAAVSSMTDLSPSFNPFSSPPSAQKDPRAAVLSPMSASMSSPVRLRATSAGAGGSGSPSLRDEEEQFYKDLLSLESRLLRVQKNKKHVAV